MRSNTGQLTWNYAGKGYFTVNTPGTQAVVGFAQGMKLDLADVTLQTNTPFVSLFVTSLDPQKPIAQASSLLITAVARARNTCMQYNANDTQVLNVGHAPILMESVDATITVRGRGQAKVQALDHSGHLTATAVPVQTQGQGATFHIGGDYRTLYYEVTF